MSQYVVLQVIEGNEGMMATYGPQVATIQDYENELDAATFNVGSHPDYDERGRPYRVVVIPYEHWKEYEVHSDSIQGNRKFVAYPSTDLTIRPVGSEG